MSFNWLRNKIPSKLIITTVVSTHKKSAQMCFNSKRFPIDSIKMSITILESMSEQMFVLNDKQGKKRDRLDP